MPKLPRDVDAERLIRFLVRRGWRVAREGGRHTVMARGSAQASVPRHGALKPGTLAAILKQAEVPRDEWADL